MTAAGTGPQAQLPPAAQRPHGVLGYSDPAWEHARRGLLTNEGPATRSHSAAVANTAHASTIASGKRTAANLSDGRRGVRSEVDRTVPATVFPARPR
jgi:hypothetical protein